MEDDDFNEEGYELSEPHDFDEFTKLIINGDATDRHHNEFYLRIISNFCTSVQSNKLPETWVLNAISNSLFKVIMGGRWEDELPLPWTRMSQIRTDAESKDLDIFREIAIKLKDDPMLNVVETITSVANEKFVSFEKARAAYYKYKKLIQL